jgi:hypothetical protein
MRLRFGLVIFILISGFFLSAQTIDIFNVPGVPPAGSGGVKGPGMAVNSRGDVMVVFRNKKQKTMYYFEKKNGGGTPEPVSIPGTPGDVIHTSVTTLVASADDHFHALWNSDLEPKGMFYAEFDIQSERWGTVTRLSFVESRDPQLLLNPQTGDLAAVTLLRIPGANDKIALYIRKFGQSQWSAPLDISQGAWVGHLQACFDEDGYLYLVYREEMHTEEELYFIKAVLVRKNTDGNYQKVSAQDITHLNPGWHFLPSIAATGRKGIITFVWTQKDSYYYVPFERTGDSLVFDPSRFIAIATAPTRPWFRFFSKTIAHGDEIFYVYTDMKFSLKLLRYKNGQWLNSQPVALMNDSLNKFPFQLFSEPNSGFYAIWFWENDRGDGVSSYCFYNYPKPRIGAPLNVRALKTIERSFFQSFPIYVVDWEANPANQENNITITAYKVYRRPRSGGSWTQAGSVAGTVFRFIDYAGITSASDFVYGVSAVNDKNQESSIQEVGIASVPDSIFRVSPINAKSLESRIRE